MCAVAAEQARRLGCCSRLAVRRQRLTTPAGSVALRWAAPWPPCAAREGGGGQGVAPPAGAAGAAGAAARCSCAASGHTTRATLEHGVSASGSQQQGGWGVPTPGGGVGWGGVGVASREGGRGWGSLAGGLGWGGADLLLWGREGHGALEPLQQHVRCTPKVLQGADHCSSWSSMG
jgi:hypothetical protein